MKNIVSNTILALALIIAQPVYAKTKHKHHSDDAGYPLETKDGPVLVGGERGEFIAQARVYARMIQQQYGIPASATIAMAIYESNYGRSYLAREGNNYFGIKAFNWGGSEIRSPRDGIRYRAYGSMKAGFIGYAEFLSKPRYRRAFGEHNGLDFVEEILSCGYCPSSRYSDDIRHIIDTYGLSKYDRS